ncbi:hypothetical protein EDC04DRAFT_776003 [Pisolithus marmoratus]|nr:hypothetical protein EDC04DRAFT_776003 [Pisolithus marmoratus]
MSLGKISFGDNSIYAFYDLLSTATPALMPLQLEISSVFQLVASTILCYDYLLTLRREVDFFWMKPRRSWMFVLFVANRYITILGRVPTMVGAVLATKLGGRWHGTCETVSAYNKYVIITVQIIGGILMIIRVYALYMKSKRVIFFLVSVILADIAVGCVGVMPTIMSADDNHLL